MFILWERINLFLTLSLWMGCCYCLQLWRMWISGSWILNKESDFWNGLDNETAWLFLVMNWLLKKVEFHLLLSCLLESGLSYGLDDWRRKVIVTAMVLMIEGGCFLGSKDPLEPASDSHSFSQSPKWNFFESTISQSFFMLLLLNFEQVFI